MSSSGEFYFHDELASLFAPGDLMMSSHQQQAPAASWLFADYLQGGAPMPTDYELLCRALDLPVAADDVAVKRELVVDTGGGGGARTPSGCGTAPVTPNTTSSMSASSSEAAGGGGGGEPGGSGAGDEDSCKKEERDAEDSKESGKGGQEDGDKAKKG
jgi:hypothetical protein